MIDFKRYYMFKKYILAFTLAEILITLGIIGIVAAITLPSVISEYKKSVVENKLKVAYSITSQVLEKVNAENDLTFIPDEFYDDGFEENWSFELSEAVFNHYFAPNMKNIKEYTESTVPYVCNYKGEGCYQNSAYKCSMLPNGVLLCFVIKKPTGTMSFRYIINPSKETLIAGKDVFALSAIRDITQNNFNMKLISNKSNYPIEEVSEYCKDENSKIFHDGSDREFWCTRLIRANGWKIPPNYPIRL